MKRANFKKRFTVVLNKDQYDYMQGMSQMMWASIDQLMQRMIEDCINQVISAESELIFNFAKHSPSIQ